jgi:hypothetical protein
MVDDELTPSERKSFEGLPRERVPEPGLEERTVRGLRGRGLLRARSPRGIVLSPTWIALAAGLAVALLAGGFALGQWVGSRQTAKAMLAVQEQDGLRLAAEVQRTGTAYVTALNTLVENLKGEDPQVQAQGRQVAISALYAAADLVVTIAPDEPMAQNIVWALDESRGPTAQADTAATRHYVWF